MTDSKRPLTIDDAVAAIRDEEVPAATVSEAGARVWPRVVQQSGLGPADPSGTFGFGVVKGCSDVQELLPAFGRGELAGPRGLLIEDHLRECATCRAVFRQPGTPRLAVLPWRPASPAPAPPRPGIRRYAVAAAVVLSVGLAGFAVQQALFGIPAGSRAEVQSVSGLLQRVAAGEAKALPPGSVVGEGEAVRTGRASQAFLRLRDGSVVEMGERAEISIAVRGRDTTIHLERGNIIVQAAKRRVGRLRVASRDCTVSVTGTVFSVSNALKGSRVSVIEGQVRVAQGRHEQVLQPGDQMVTSPAVAAVSLRDDIAWSRNLDGHLAVLAELSKLRKDLQAVPLPGLRYESRLLRLVPPNAVVYAALPNYGESLAQAHEMFEERLAQSPVLRQWWEQVDPARRGGPSLSEVVDKVRGFAGYLGDEVVFAAFSDGRGQPKPLLMAEVRQAGLEDFLRTELDALGGEGGPPVRLLGREASTGSRSPHDLFVIIQDDVLALSSDANVLRTFGARLRNGAAALDQTPFGRRIAEAYAGGAGLLFAADVQALAHTAAATHGAPHSPPPAALGLDDLRHLVVESKQVGGQTLSQAVLTVAGPRRGIASWLGSPAAMGSLEFLSPQATAAAAFIVKSPALLLDDVLAAAPDAKRGPHQALAELESHLNVRLREDVAETLGGEFAFALDGPLLPTPSWKVVVEVYDPARLQAAIESVVRSSNQDAARERRPELHLDAEQAGGETYYALRAAGGRVPFEAHYAFSDGYLVLAPSRALVMKAMQVRESGASLARSERFQSLLPADGRANVSALVFQDFGSLLRVLAGGVGALGPDERESLANLARDAQPSLVCAYGEDDRFRVAGSGGLFSLDPGAAALPGLVGRLLPGTSGRRSP